MILIIEDNPAIQQLLSYVVHSEGYSVVCATNGRDGLAWVNRLRPDAIILDLEMPVMDGQAFIAAYHKLPTKHAPIILTTAAEVNRGQFPGIAQFVRKPFDVDELLNALETVLDQRQPFGMSA